MKAESLQMLMYVPLTAITFLIGLFANPFVTFILTMVVMYAVNYMAGSEGFAAELLPSYWSNQILLKQNEPEFQGLISAGAAIVLTVAVIRAVMVLFQRKDIK